MNHRLGQLGPVEMGHVLLGERLVEGREAIEHRLAPGLGVKPELVGDFSDGERRAQVLGLEMKGLHGDQVDQPLELAHRPLRPGADGDLDRDRVALQEPFLDLLVDPLELGTDAVHLVDEAEPGDMILGRLPPDGLALGLDSLDRRKDDDRAVEHAERPLDLGGEVHVAGGVDDVDRDRLPVGVLPAAGDRRRDDRDAPLPLLFQVVGRRVSLVHVPHPMDLTGVVEDAFGGRGLAGVDVGNDADIADLAEVRLVGVAGHVRLFLFPAVPIHPTWSGLAAGNPASVGFARPGPALESGP